jgi:lipid II:glycine glycyltransferase (peptidoglycan interpeptide bridge formation enzyme)
METAKDGQSWNDAVRNNFHTFFQSWEWGKMQETLGRKSLLGFVQGIPVHLFRYQLPFGKAYMYCPGGPSCYPGDDGILELKEAIAEAVPEAVFVRFEPWVVSAGFETMTRGIARQPTLQSVMDVFKPEDVLMKEMADDRRRSIRTAEKRGVLMRMYSRKDDKEAHFNDFWNIYTELSARKNLSSHPEEYYRGVLGLDGDCKSKLFVAELEGKPINAAITIYFGDTAYYLFAASMLGFERFNAPSLTLWSVIKDAKSEGAKFLNLGGISHTSPAKKGFTEFKQRFGAKEVSLPGAFDLVLDSSSYFLYRMATSLKILHRPW